MSKQECPASYVEHSDACYYFGSYSSYEEAKQSCELEDARLADVGPINNNFIKEQVKNLGSNNHWIGSYRSRGKLIKKKSGRCPMLNGPNRGEAFTHISCNSAYPFVCQKYGENKGKISGFPGFNPDLGEFEISVTTTEASTTSSKPTDSNSSVVAVVVCIVALIVFAIFTRCMCNKRAERRLKKKKKEQLQEKIIVGNGYDNNNFTDNLNNLSRANTLTKPFFLPEISTENISRTITRRSSFDDDVCEIEPGQKSFQESMQQQYNEGRRYRRSHRERSHHRYHRSESGERYEHGYHSSPAPSPFGSHYKDRSFRSERNRRRSIGSTLDVDTFDYSGRSRDSSPDSSLTDSAISTSIGSHRHRARSLRRKSVGSIRYYDQNGYRRSSRRRRKAHRSHSRHGRRSRYEEYAENRPPSPALDILERHVDSKQFHEQQTYLRGRDPFRGEHDIREDYSRSQNETLKPIYFPQMATTWSADDLKVASEPGFDNSPKEIRPLYPRAYPKGPIRVNRHIHDHQMARSSASTPPELHSDDSEHIYESLDDVKMPNNQLHRAVPLQPTSFSSQNVTRSSARSRASMRNRRLPATPMT